MTRIDRWGLSSAPAGGLIGHMIMPHIRGIVQKAHEKDLPETFERIGINMISATASFVDSHRIEVKGRTLSARNFIIATGRVGRHTAWAYCHVPHGYREEVTDLIEDQIERYAPGFREIIPAKNSMPAVDMERHNPNYVGGDINGGLQDFCQLYTRPVMSFSPYRTSKKNVFICSSSTPPGGGVHGLCG